LRASMDLRCACTVETDSVVTANIVSTSGQVSKYVCERACQ
jgi:hypothetical protein